MEEIIIEEFVQNSLYRLDESTRMNTISLQQLSEEDIWKRPNGSLNSVGNLLLHLCGNITQYVISSLGGQEDVRERDLEFETRSGYSKSELLEKLNETVEKAKRIINDTKIEQFIRKRDVQGYYFSGIGVVLHAVEHYSYHTGQIAFYTKLLKNTDLGFYDGQDLNLKNE
ncbi:DinB family protein [Maribacter polysaccharolyticus]|uniref:DinB family protein n=1 Tax=Maribacter polysaccharolyticus TaxID=3020831 RepID=UPI00237F1F7C|nr:DinB family protein [Maribacter polysaccharolyticus]MDE3740394.1 DinB family protein [Maribacter polysaccharolyticus]